MSGVREKKRDLERLSRGQSHDLLTRLENAGLTAGLANRVIGAHENIARAMLFASGWRWADAVADWWQHVAERVTEGMSGKIAADGQHLVAGCYIPHIGPPEHPYQCTIAVPNPYVTVGMLVERALAGQALFSMPPMKELPMWALVEVMKWQIVEKKIYRSDLNPQMITRLTVCEQFAEWEPREQGYWYWMSMHPGVLFEKRQVGMQTFQVRHNDTRDLCDGNPNELLLPKQISAERIRRRCASLEEFLVAYFCGEAIGWPLEQDEPRCPILRTTTRWYDREPGDAVRTFFLQWAGREVDSDRPDEPGRDTFKWLHSDIAQLSEWASRGSAILGYYEVERLALDPVLAASAA